MTLSKMFHHVFCSRRGNRIQRGISSATKYDEIHIGKIGGVRLCFRWMDAKLKCHQSYCRAFRIVEVEFEYFRRIVMEPFFRFGRCCKLRLEGVVLRRKIRKLRSQNFNLCSQITLSRGGDMVTHVNDVSFQRSGGFPVNDSPVKKV